MLFPRILSQFLSHSGEVGDKSCRSSIRKGRREVSASVRCVDENASKTRIKNARMISRQEGSDCTKEWSRDTAGLFEGYEERSTIWTSADCVRKWKISIRVENSLQR